MRKVLIGMAAVSLAGCQVTIGGNGSNSSAAPAGNTMAAPAAPGNMAAPGPMTPGGNDMASAPNPGRRAQMVSHCSAEVESQMPNVQDINGLCECAVDRVIGQFGQPDPQTRQREALRQCAQQLGIEAN